MNGMGEPPIVHPWWNKEEQAAYLKEHDRFAKTLPPYGMEFPKGTMSTRMCRGVPVLYKTLSHRKNARCCIHGRPCTTPCSLCLSYGRCSLHRVPTALCSECTHSVCKHGFSSKLCSRCRKKCPTTGDRMGYCLHCKDEEAALPLWIRRTPILPCMHKHRKPGRTYRTKDSVGKWILRTWDGGSLVVGSWTYERWG